MQTRRQLLQQAVSVPLVMRLHRTHQESGVEIIAEPNCLSEESAEGFRALLASPTKHQMRNVILLCGVSSLSRQRACNLRDRALGGSRIILENSPFWSEQQKHVFEDAFGIGLHHSIAISSDEPYVKYNWPVSALTRTFSMVTPISCADNEVIARYNDIPVAMERRIGRGGFVFLGSMLGPNLHAEEREAKQIATAIFSKIASACTSTEA